MRLVSWREGGRESVNFLKSQWKTYYRQETHCSPNRLSHLAKIEVRETCSDWSPVLRCLRPSDWPPVLWSLWPSDWSPVLWSLRPSDWPPVLCSLRPSDWSPVLCSLRPGDSGTVSWERFTPAAATVKARWKHDAGPKKLFFHVGNLRVTTIPTTLPLSLFLFQRQPSLSPVGALRCLLSVCMRVSLPLPFVDFEEFCPGFTTSVRNKYHTNWLLFQALV